MNVRSLLGLTSRPAFARAVKYWLRLGGETLLDIVPFAVTLSLITTGILCPAKKALSRNACPLVNSTTPSVLAGEGISTGFALDKTASTKRAASGWITLYERATNSDRPE